MCACWECEQVPFLVDAAITLPSGSDRMTPYAKKSFTIKYEGPGADQTSSIGVLLLSCIATAMLIDHIGTCVWFIRTSHIHHSSEVVSWPVLCERGCGCCSSRAGKFASEQKRRHDYQPSKERPSGCLHSCKDTSWVAPVNSHAYVYRWCMGVFWTHLCFAGNLEAWRCETSCAFSLKRHSDACAMRNSWHDLCVLTYGHTIACSVMRKNSHLHHLSVSVHVSCIIIIIKQAALWLQQHVHMNTHMYPWLIRLP